MPFLHRYLGNPVLSFLGRHWFIYGHVRQISTAACAALRRERSSSPRSCTATGMEFVTEMVVRAALAGYSSPSYRTTLTEQTSRSRRRFMRRLRTSWRHRGS